MSINETFQHTLIIPDVHGRSFWKDAVKRYPDADTIFIGDYHDPYPHEDISEEESLENFRELIYYCREHDNCHLLLGNHDLQYLCDFGEACRLDYDNYEAIRQILHDNLSRMSIATTREIGGKTVLFSHAPILQEWIDIVGETGDVPTLVERLNGLPATTETDPGRVEAMLGHTSDYRGGYDPVGSPVWADMREILYDNKILANADYCIFGHTQLRKAVITETWADLDCRSAFLLLPDLSIKEA